MKNARALIFAAVAACSAPPEQLTVAEWSEKRRYVAAESGSAHPGRWDNRLTEYAIQPMLKCSTDSGAKRVSMRASAQTMKSELLLNTMFCRMEVKPGPMMLVLPSGEEVSSWNRTKWRPNVQVTPTINKIVAPERSRDETGSTLKYKAYTGGYVIVASAGSSKDLQAKSARDIFIDELSEMPADTKGRGDPLVQARHRQDGQGDETFEFCCSTPKELPACRITKMVEAGDLRRYYIPCPQCGDYQQLLFDNFAVEKLQPHFVCEANGCVIEETSKRRMLRYGYEGEKPGRAEWIPTFESKNKENPPPPNHFPPEDLKKWLNRDTEGRNISYDMWQAYSTLKPWSKIAEEWRSAQGDPDVLKVYWQQVLAKPYDGGGEAPDFEKLYARRDLSRDLGTVPFGYWILTGAADIQSDRIEAAVWAWGPGGAGFCVAREVFPGKPTSEFDKCWRELAEFRSKTFEGENGHDFKIDVFLVDAGYSSPTVYTFCNARGATMACKGMGDQFHSAIGAPSYIKKAAAKPGKKARPAAYLYPIGGYGLKQALYEGLRATIDGPDDDGVWNAGAQRFPADFTENDCKQLTSEVLMPVRRSNGQTGLQWEKLAGRANEMLDIWCYARAGAIHLGIQKFDREKWEEIATHRGGAGDGNAGGLEKMWNAAGMPSPDATPDHLPGKKKKRRRGQRGRIH